VESELFSIPLEMAHMSAQDGEVYQQRDSAPLLPSLISLTPSLSRMKNKRKERIN
jgi:hypothetical protein